MTEEEWRTDCYWLKSDWGGVKSAKMENAFKLFISGNLNEKKGHERSYGSNGGCRIYGSALHNCHMRK